MGVNGHLKSFFSLFVWTPKEVNEPMTLKV